jgi:secreted Zn-dependent insulinase-like peptidase
VPIFDEGGSKVWFLADASFREPKVEVRLNLRSAIGQRTATEAALLRLFMELIKAGRGGGCSDAGRTPQTKRRMRRRRRV